MIDQRCKSKALYGEYATSAAWSEIDNDARLRLPREITDGLDWCIPGEKCEVLLELRQKGSILIHGGICKSEIEKMRQDLLSDLDDKVEAYRRTAISHVMYIPAIIGRTNRRVTLPSDLLLHLGTTKSSRVLCLVYENRVEVLNEFRAEELMDAARVDINLESFAPN